MSDELKPEVIADAAKPAAAAKPAVAAKPETPKLKARVEKAPAAEKSSDALAKAKAAKISQPLGKPAPASSQKAAEAADAKASKLWEQTRAACSKASCAAA